MMGEFVAKDETILEENIRKGTRFGRMFEAVRCGDTLEQMKCQWPDIDESTHRVLTMIIDGTISLGSNTPANVHTQNTASKIEARKRRLFQLFDAGYSTWDVSARTGLTRRYVQGIRSMWAAQNKR